MIKATRSSRKNRNNRSNVIYSESFAGTRQYVNGTAAPDDFWRERSQEDVHRSTQDLRLAARRSREHVVQMNLRYTLFMAFLVAAMTFSLIGYIKLKADISGTNKKIASPSNNEVYNEITGNVDLEEIRNIAVNEFGMKYADKDQIVIYSESKGDSVHQIADLDH